MHTSTVATGSGLRTPWRCVRWKRPMEESRTISVEVNGIAYERDVRVRTSLADFLRHDLMLTGTHVGCEHGVCGACTVLVNGRSARSCLMLAVQVDGASVMTIEGVAPSPV